MVATFLAIARQTPELESYSIGNGRYVFGHCLPAARAIDNCYWFILTSSLKSASKELCDIPELRLPCLDVLSSVNRRQIVLRSQANTCSHMMFHDDVVMFLFRTPLTSLYSFYNITDFESGFNHMSVLFTRGDATSLLLMHQPC